MSKLNFMSWSTFRLKDWLNKHNVLADWDEKVARKQWERIVNKSIKLKTVETILRGYTQDTKDALGFLPDGFEDDMHTLFQLANNHKNGYSWDGYLLVDKRAMSRDFEDNIAYTRWGYSPYLWEGMELIERHNVL